MKLPACLRYAGQLGHEYVVTRRVGDGNEEVYVECNNTQRARDQYLSVPPDARGGIYRRRAKGWKRVLLVGKEGGGR